VCGIFPNYPSHGVNTNLYRHGFYYEPIHRFSYEYRKFWGTWPEFLKLHPNFISNNLDYPKLIKTIFKWNKINYHIKHWTQTPVSNASKINAVTLNNKPPLMDETLSKNFRIRLQNLD